MNIGNITPNNFNLNGVGKDIQIEVYEQLIGQLQQENKQLKDNWNMLKEYILANSYLDLAGNRCWVNKHSAKNVINILESISLSQ